jgi:hypothetical protein
VTLAVALFAVLLIAAGLIAWQHSRRNTPVEVTYGVEDAVSYIHSRLDSVVAERLGFAGLRRIIEWEVFYLQGLAQPDRREPVVSVAGDYPPAVEFIGREIAHKHGLTYSSTDISSVLELEASYLESIGAVGKAVGGSEL